MAEQPQTGIVAIPAKKALAAFAERFGLDPEKMLGILKKTIIKKRNGEPTNEEVAAFVAVANQYQLSPFTREIHAFESNGAIVPIVGIDGWVKIVNRSDGFDGCDFEEIVEKGTPVKTTCRMYVQGRNHPITVTEWFDECKRNTDPWNKMPKRMLRHKAYIQAARVAFGLSGIYDEDEAEDIRQNARHVDAQVVDNGKSKTEQLVDKLKGQPRALEAPESDLPPEIVVEPVQDEMPPIREEDVPQQAEEVDEAKAIEAVKEGIKATLSKIWPRLPTLRNVTVENSVKLLPPNAGLAEWQREAAVIGYFYDLAMVENGTKRPTDEPSIKKLLEAARIKVNG